MSSFVAWKLGSTLKAPATIIAQVGMNATLAHGVRPSTRVWYAQRFINTKLLKNKKGIKQELELRNDR